MKNILLFLALFVSVSLSAQIIPDTTKKSTVIIISSTILEFQRQNYDDINYTLRNNGYPNLNDATIRFNFSSRIKLLNSGFISGAGFEFMQYSFGYTNSQGNSSSLKDIGANFLIGYNFLYKNPKVYLFPYFRSSLVYRNLNLVSTKNGSSTTLNNLLNGSVTSTSLGNIAANLDLGVTFETNLFRTQRIQSLIGFSLGYRLSPIQGFGENGIFRITDASGRYTDANLGGFYFGVNLSSYPLKPKRSKYQS